MACMNPIARTKGNDEHSCDDHVEPMAMIIHVAHTYIHQDDVGLCVRGWEGHDLFVCGARTIQQVDLAVSDAIYYQPHTIRQSHTASSQVPPLGLRVVDLRLIKAPTDRTNMYESARTEVGAREKSRCSTRTMGASEGFWRAPIGVAPRPSRHLSAH
jgi:hypothetical protein